MHSTIPSSLSLHGRGSAGEVDETKQRKKSSNSSGSFARQDVYNAKKADGQRWTMNEPREQCIYYISISIYA